MTSHLCTIPPTARKLHNKGNSTNCQNTERPPQTQQYEQDEETEKYPAGVQTRTQNNKVMGSYLLIITFNVNGLNAPTKRQRLAEWIQKQDPYIWCLQ